MKIVWVKSRYWKTTWHYVKGHWETVTYKSSKYTKVNTNNSSGEWVPAYKDPKFAATLKINSGKLGGIRGDARGAIIALIITKGSEYLWNHREEIIQNINAYGEGLVRSRYESKFGYYNQFIH